MEVDERRIVLLCESVRAVPSAALYIQFKSFDFFKNTLYRLFRNLYNELIGPEFVEVMKNLITGQIIDAYIKEWQAEGMEGNPPAYLSQSAEQMVNQQHEFVEPLYRDIINARIDGAPFEPFLMRADMWANRYKEAQANAVSLITAENGGKLVWIFNPEKEHCETCASLNGVVAWATEWQTSGLRPQSAPNQLLECGGWQCGCVLEVTDKRRSPRALDTLMNIAISRKI